MLFSSVCAEENQCFVAVGGEPSGRLGVNSPVETFEFCGNPILTIKLADRQTNVKVVFVKIALQKLRLNVH